MIVSLIGMIVIAAIFAFGVYYVASRVTFRDTPNRYAYRKDADGNDVVKDTKDAE